MIIYNKLDDYFVVSADRQTFLDFQICFLRGGGRVQTKKPSMGGQYGYFLELRNIACLCKLYMLSFIINGCTQYL